MQYIGGLGKLCKRVWAMGARTVDCVTIRPASSRFAIVALHLVDIGQTHINDPAITALVLLTWALWRNRHPDDEELWLLAVHYTTT